MTLVLVFTKECVLAALLILVDRTDCHETGADDTEEGVCCDHETVTMSSDS